MRHYYPLMLLVLFFACRQQEKKPILPDIIQIEGLFREKMNQFRLTEQQPPLYQFLDSLRSDTSFAGSKPHMATWYRIRAFVDITLRNLDTAGLYLDSASAIITADPTMLYQKMQLNAHYGELLGVQNQLAVALQYIQEAYWIASKNYPENIDKYRAMMIQCLMEAGDLNNALLYAKETLASQADPIYMDQSASVIAAIFAHRKQDDSAFYYLRKAHLSNLALSPAQTLDRMLNAGMALHNDGHIRQAYDYFQLCYEYAHEKKLMTPSIYEAFAAVKQNLGDKTLSGKLMDSAIHLAIGLKDYKLVSEVFVQKAKVQATPASAGSIQLMDSAIMFKRKADSIQYENQSQELDKKYRLREKEDEIKNLAKQEADSRTINSLLSLVLVITAILIVGAIFYFRSWKKRREEKLLIRDQELLSRILRSQIDSHFWISSLTAIQGEIEASKNTSALFYLKQFARLATVNMRNSSHDKIALREELAGITSYLELQKAIHEGKFDFRIKNEVGPEDESIFITTMLIQPFVENAVVHGMANIASNGLIVVTLKRSEEILICTVEDNGAGLPKRTKKGGKLSASTLITEDRLKILSKLSGKTASLKVEEVQSPGSGIRVTLCIPFIEDWRQATA